MARAEATDQRTFAKALRARAVRQRCVARTFRSRLQAGRTIKATELIGQFDWPEFLAQDGAASLRLFVLDPAGRLHVAGAQRRNEPRTGWTVPALVPPAGADGAKPDRVKLRRAVTSSDALVPT